MEDQGKGRKHRANVRFIANWKLQSVKYGAFFGAIGFPEEDNANFGDLEVLTSRTAIRNAD